MNIEGKYSNNDYRPKLSKHELILERYKTILQCNNNHLEEKTSTWKKPQMSFTSGETQMKKIDSLLEEKLVKRMFIENEGTSQFNSGMQTIESIKEKYNISKKQIKTGTVNALTLSNERNSSSEIEQIKSKYFNNSLKKHSTQLLCTSANAASPLDKTIVMNNIRTNIDLLLTNTANTDLEEKSRKNRANSQNKDKEISNANSNINTNAKDNENTQKGSLANLANANEKTIDIDNENDNELILSRITLIENKIKNINSLSTASLDKIKKTEIEKKDTFSEDQTDQVNLEQQVIPIIAKIESLKHFKLKSMSPKRYPKMASEYSKAAVNDILNSCIKDITRTLFENSDSKVSNGKSNIINNSAEDSSTSKYDERFQASVKGKMIKSSGHKGEPHLKKKLSTFEEFLEMENRKSN